MKHRIWPSVSHVKHFRDRHTILSELSLNDLGGLVAHKRGKLGVRVTAKAIGISPATLIRIEKGHLPDLENFRKICIWLELDPSAVLGIDTAERELPTVSVHFRKDQTMMPETSIALSEMILAAQQALVAQSTQESQ